MRSEWEKERPKFCAGELVGLVCTLRPELSCSSIEVQRLERHIDSVVALHTPYKGWIYSLVGSQFTWCEIALRKLPKDPEQSFASMMERLTREGELEKAWELPEASSYSSI